MHTSKVKEKMTHVVSTAKKQIALIVSKAHVPKKCSMGRKFRNCLIRMEIMLQIIMLFNQYTDVTYTYRYTENINRYEDCTVDESPTLYTHKTEENREIIVTIHSQKTSYLL